MTSEPGPVRAMWNAPCVRLHNPSIMLTPKAAACSVAAAALIVAGHALAQNPRRSVVINGREAAAAEVLVRFARQPDETERLAIERDADAAESEPIGPAFRRMR